MVFRRTIFRARFWWSFK